MPGNRAVQAVFSAAALLVLSGCGPQQATAVIEKTAEVSGVITYQGRPLDHYEVLFYPEGHRPAAGKTDEQGRFTLGTNGPGDGAVPGRHKVVVHYVGPEIAQEPGKEEAVTPSPARVKVPDKYTARETSDVFVDVPDGGTRELVVDLK